MSTDSPHAFEDPLIDEVRAVRRSIAERLGDDLDALFAELQRVDQELRFRTGRFATLPHEPRARELFPDAAAPRPDPLLDELRQLRRR